MEESRPINVVKSRFDINKRRSIYASRFAGGSIMVVRNRLQLMKQDLEKAENAYLSSFTSKKSKTLPVATAAAHGDQKWQE
ncbi:hypothetical protein TNCV_4340011 [Trichonephila clavipes]|nr:hypothetical protein TNCV_4340011 [Trichonephila clavipes]